MSLRESIRRWTRSEWSGVAEFYLRPGLKTRFGGPLNGQEFRRKIYHELIGLLGFDAVIECGTYRGTSTVYLQETSGLPVDTVEADARLFGYCRTRFASNARIRTHHGDSRTVLRKLIAEPRFAGRRVLTYLDAHWSEDLPLREELEILFQSKLQNVAVIDDFCVPGDDGYGYDDYGPGKALTVDYLDQVPELNLRRFFPTAPSSAETGCRRGCVVVASGNLAKAIAAHCRTLREDISTEKKVAA